MKREWIEKRLAESHEAEDMLNKEMSEINKQIDLLILKKETLANRVSKNMKNRNHLIDMKNGL